MLMKASSKNKMLVRCLTDEGCRHAGVLPAPWLMWRQHLPYCRHAPKDDHGTQLGASGVAQHGYLQGHI